MKIQTKQFFNENIFDVTIENAFYRKEIVTGQHSQVVIMSIPVGEEIGAEAHTVDQILIFVQGNGQAIINDVTSEVYPNHLVFVPAGTKHNFKNTGSENLKLFTIYAPAEDAPGTLQETKPEE
jgi:mannose-6-phosphate isomerase-like protein (cupin superfamily)